MSKPLAILISALTAIIIFLFMYIWETDKRVQGLQSANAAQQSEISYHTSRSGKLIAERQAAELRVKEFKETYPKMAEDITRDFDIKIKNLKAYMQSEFQAVGKGDADITNNYYTDSTGVRRSYWELKASDGYLDFSSTVLDSLHAPYKYTYSDTIKYAFSVKKKWLFGKQSLYGSGMLGNPNAKITNTQSVLINDFKDKRFGVGPYVGYGLNGKVSFGLSVQYSLIKF